MKDSIINLLKVLSVLVIIILGSAISIILIPTIAILVFAIKSVTYIYNEIKFSIKLSKIQNKIIKDCRDKEPKEVNYAKKIVEGIQKNEQPGRKTVYSEEYIPITQDDLINESMQIDALLTLNNLLEEKIKTTTNKQELETLKRELIKNSFKLQDATMEDNYLLTEYTIKDIADNKEQIQELIQQESNRLKRIRKRWTRKFHRFSISKLKK